MSNERIELLLDLLLAAEVRNLAVSVRSRDAKLAGDDSINKRPVEQYLPAALERLLSVVEFLRRTPLSQPTHGTKSERSNEDLTALHGSSDAFGRLASG
jgi:hypothetical protein